MNFARLFSYTREIERDRERERDANDALSQMIDEMQVTHEQKTDKLLASYKETIDNLSTNHAHTINRLRAEHAIEIDRLRDEIERERDEKIKILDRLLVRNHTPTLNEPLTRQTTNSAEARALLPDKLPIISTEQIRRTGPVARARQEAEKQYALEQQIAASATAQPSA